MENTRESLGKILYPALLIIVFGLVLVFTVRGPGFEQPDDAELAGVLSGAAADRLATVTTDDQEDASGTVEGQSLAAVGADTSETDVTVVGADAEQTRLTLADAIPTGEAVIGEAPGEAVHESPQAVADAHVTNERTVATMANAGQEAGALNEAIGVAGRVAHVPPTADTRPVPAVSAVKEAIALTPPAPEALPVVQVKEDKVQQAAATSEPTPNIGGPIAEDLMAAGIDGSQVQVYEHTVRLGETLTDIAKAYNIDIDTILAANDIPDPNRIRSGDKLSVPNVKGVIHEVKRGESLWNIANDYNVTVDEIVLANELVNPNTLQVGQSLLIPGAQSIIGSGLRESLIAANGGLLRNFSWPVTGRISSLFGMRTSGMHYGLDIAVPTGTPVRAAAAGKVTYSADAGTYGLLVKLDHGNGIETRYAHNSRLVVKSGQKVSRGDIIAYSGNTGRSTGPHVHFEIRRNGNALDPLDFLR